MELQQPHVNVLVLDATPLITHSYTHYQSYANEFFTTPTVFNEIKDEKSRKNLELWQNLGTLKLKHPSSSSIKRVADFAKLTGDYSVLSANDIHILALAYELESKLNDGDWRLRKKPGDELSKEAVPCESQSEEPKEVSAVVEAVESAIVKKKRTRRGGKKQRGKREAALSASHDPAAEHKEVLPDLVDASQNPETAPTPNQSSEGLSNTEYFEGDDDGEWITPDNLTEAIVRDSGEDTTGGEGVLATENKLVSASLPENQVALATGDFAVQNVALQLNLSLMNFTSGLRIKKLRNYMLRCHACFQMLPMPKDGKPKHFCPSCGGSGTLLRCAVSVDSKTGKVTPHLKANFQWNNRGNRYSLPSPLSKNSQKKFGKKGFVHTKHAGQAELLREDQKEYEQAVKQDEWTRRHNEKVLNSWISGGSADNFISPFAITGLKHHTVRVGRGRHANSVGRKK